jgi:hypothetical protein
MKVTRLATEDEVNYYLKSRDIDKCCFSGCWGPRDLAKTACDTHHIEFIAQRETGIYDFRLWALMKMERYDPKKDPTVEIFPVQISTAPCGHKQEATRRAPQAISLARMWRDVYNHPEDELPEEDIYVKHCACCESDEFSQSGDYICLWCRWAEL